MIFSELPTCYSLDVKVCVYRGFCYSSGVPWNVSGVPQLFLWFLFFLLFVTTYLCERYFSTIYLAYGFVCWNMDACKYFNMQIKCKQNNNTADHNPRLQHQVEICLFINGNDPWLLPERSTDIEWKNYEMSSTTRNVWEHLQRTKKRFYTFP